MKTFSVKFKVGCVDLDAIVTESDHNRRFKIELVTGESNPIVLKRSEDGTWSVVHSGSRSLALQAFEDIQKEIDAYLKASKSV